MIKRVLVVGDVILDKYTHGTRLGLSAETPTVVAKLSKKEKFVGGAGLVVRNLLRLGCEVVLMTVTGEGESINTELVESSDPPTKEEMHRLHYSPVVMPGWNLPVKHRFFVDDYKMVQYDILNEGHWDHKVREKFFEDYKEHTRNCNAVIICDNRHGVMDNALARCMVEAYHPEMFVDVQVSQKEGNHHWYSQADYMLMNERELDSCFKMPKAMNLEDKMGSVADRFIVNPIVKLGSAGSLAKLNYQWYRNHPPEVKAIDTCGAGDAFLAALVASRKEGWEERLQDANNWAARSTTYKGTIVPEVLDEETLSR